MPVSKNTWNKGLNSDFSKLKSQQDSYLSAKNIRVMTDEGSSSFAIENIKGNEFSFNIPPVEATYTITIPEGYFGTMYVDLQRSSYLESLQVDNIENKSYEFITEELNAKLQVSNFPGKEYTRFYFNSAGIVLYDFLPNSSTLPSIGLTVYNAVSDLRTNRIAIHTILGWGYYNNTIVIITCSFNSNNESPEDEEGFIWSATYDNETNTIQVADIDDDYLNTNTTLKYVGKLNLSKQYAIYKHLKCRYESTEIARVVWTDSYNNLRTCNILDPQIFATPAELLSYIPIHIPQKPVVSAIIPGGTLPTGKYQYFYQLYSNQGAVSSFSPVSNLVNLYPSAGRTYALPATNPGTGAANSPQISIINLDTNYDTIRCGYIVYQIPDFPEAFFFDERPIPDNGELTIVHNGNENDESIDSTTISNLNRPPEVFKTIDVVRNRLFAANAVTNYFDLTNEFDARVYRYDSSGIAKLYNIDDTYPTASVEINIITNEISIEGDSPVTPIDYTLIPDTFDCINPFNQESDSLNNFAGGDWFNNAQYKYKADLTTLGGTGLNISYEFTVQSNFARKAFWPTASPYFTPANDSTAEYTTEFSDTYTYPGGGNVYLDSPKSSLFETLFTGYSRGEVYRFGIVFFDKYGYPSYPLWIGDIKFPFGSDNNGAFGLSELAVDGLISPASFIIPDGTNISSDGTGINLTPGVSGLYYDFYLDDGFGYSIVYTWFPTATSTMADFCADFTAGNTLGIIAVQSDPLDLNKIQFIAPNNGINWLSYPFYISFMQGQPEEQTSDIYYFTGTVYPYPPSPGGNNVFLQQLGIKFSLDTTTAQFQAIKDRISGWSYVRVRRNLVDSTRLGTGYIQPCWSGGGNNLLVPFYAGLAPAHLYTQQEWGFSHTGGTPYDRIRLATQTLHIPNLLSRSVGSFATNDYIRFIGRTNDYGTLTRYTSNITTPDFGQFQTYYLATNDFDYHYEDTTFNVTGGVTTSSYVNGHDKFTLQGRVYSVAPQNAFRIPAGTIPGLSADFINMTNFDYTEADVEQFTEWGTECTLITLFDTPDTTAAYDSTILNLPMYLVSYERYLIDQYRGWTRADRYANEYILTNHFMPYPYDISIGDVVTNSVYGGDTYVNYYDYQRSNRNFFEGSGYPDGGEQDQCISLAIFFPAEVIYNADLNTTEQHASVRQNTDSILQSNYTYNAALSQQNTTNIFISKAYLQTNVKEEPHTIYGSDPKIDNERIDSWRSLFVNNSLAVNGNYGAINRIIQFKDRLFYYQNDGIGIATVDERVLENDGTTAQTQLGTGTLLQRFDYITTETGCKHAFAVESTGDSVYHYDAFINKLFKYTLGKTKVDSDGMSPLTDIKGLSGFFRTAFVNSNLKSEDKILRTGSRVGIVAAFNSEYNTIYFTFLDEPNNIKQTISYNELLEGFESFYDFFPSMYLNMRKRFISLAPTNTFSKTYIHNIGTRNIFYDAVYPSSITFRVNENSDFVKTFDNFQLNTEVILNNIQLAETVSRMSITNDYQNFPEQNVNFVQKIRSWRLAIPRDETNPALTIKPRISDKYIDVKFSYNPLGLDKTFRLHDVLTEYSMRSKILPR